MNRRELIIQHIVNVLSGSGVVKYSTRQRPEQENTLKRLSDSQFPYMAIEGGAPVLLGIVKEARKSFGAVQVFKFRLSVELNIFDKISVSVDEDYGILYDNIFTSLYSNPLLGGLADNMSINPKSHEVIEIKPYYAFRFEIDVDYKTNGGI